MAATPTPGNLFDEFEEAFQVSFPRWYSINKTGKHEVLEWSYCHGLLPVMNHKTCLEFHPPSGSGQRWCTLLPVPLRTLQFMHNTLRSDSSLRRSVYERGLRVIFNRDLSMREQCITVREYARLTLSWLSRKLPVVYMSTTTNIYIHIVINVAIFVIC